MSTPASERCYVPTELAGPVEGARIGVSWLRKHEQDATGEPLVVIPSADHAQRNEYVEAATRRYRWVSAVAFRSAVGQGWGGGPTLLLYPSEARVLEWFDRSALVPALCVVQGSRYDTTAWARARQPVDLTTGVAYPAGPPVDEAIERALLSVEEADQRPARARNLGSRADVDLAVGRLRSLADQGHAVTSSDLEAWAVAHRWSLAGAHRLALRAGPIFDGHDAAR